MLFKENKCEICQGQLSKFEEYFRARMKKTAGKIIAGRVIYRAWCDSCEIYARKAVQGQEETDWTISSVHLEELQQEISEEEIIQLKEKIITELEEQNIPLLKELWNDFIKMKKPKDQLFRYMQMHEDETTEGFVIKRGNFLIGNYTL